MRSSSTWALKEPTGYRILEMILVDTKVDLSQKDVEVQKQGGVLFYGSLHSQTTNHFLCGSLHSQTTNGGVQTTNCIGI
jgi:hypothetical protein